MSNIAQRIAYAQKELKAIKAGFAGNEDRFFPAISTSQTFTPTSNDKPIVITATFAIPDFPQLFTAVSLTLGGPPVILQYESFRRKTIYSWRLTEIWGSSANYTIQAMLLSQRAPTSFTCTVET